MKTISKILLILLLPFSFFITSNSCATDSETITVTVSEAIPGANCTCAGNILDGVCYGEPTGFNNYPPASYNCHVEKGFGSVMLMMGAIIKWFTYIAGLGIVLFIVINGIMYSMSGIDQGMKDEAKKRIGKTLMGLVILLLSGVILNAIAPWVYR